MLNPNFRFITSYPGRVSISVLIQTLFLKAAKETTIKLRVTGPEHLHLANLIITGAYLYKDV